LHETATTFWATESLCLKKNAEQLERRRSCSTLGIGFLCWRNKRTNKPEHPNDKANTNVTSTLDGGW